MRLLKVLTAPHISEKSSQNSGGYAQYAFKVLRDATKIEIKKAIEHIFNVKVRSVRVCNMKAKTTRFGRIMGQHQAWKKAYVTLNPGQEIDIAGE